MKITNFSLENKRLFPSLGDPITQYTLVRLSEASHQNVWRVLDEDLGTVTEVPSVQFMGDGVWEILVSKSHCSILQATFNEKLPGSNFEADYDPVRPTDTDLDRWSSITANELCRLWFLQRALTIVQNGWSIAASYYSSLLKRQHGLGKANIRSTFLDSTEVPFTPTYRGQLQTEEEALLLVEACIRGDFAYSYRGPRQGETPSSNNTFVWEANTTGIDRKSVV